jgi:AcrR family transcriptional regulator
MPKVVPEYRLRARDRIVDAAQEVFRTKGFRSTTMADIAAKIGVSKGALYLYFPTKLDLLAEIQRRSRERVVEEWRGLLDRGDVVEGIVASLDAVFSGSVDPGVYLELVSEASRDPALRAAMQVDRREDLREMERFLRALEDRGRIRPLPNRRTTAHILLALLEGTLTDLMLRGRTADTRRMLVRSLRYLLGPT